MSLRSTSLISIVVAAVTALTACGGEESQGAGGANHDAQPDAAGQAASPPAPGERGSLETNGAPSNQPGLEAQIRDALFTAPETTARQITVQVVDGKVKLSGFVDSATEKAAAGRVTQAVEGVVEVDNNLSVGHTDDEVGNGAVALRVKAALIKDPRTTGRQINVEVLQGVAQLSGYVESADEKKLAGDLAAVVIGVTSVENKLEVRAR